MHDLVNFVINEKTLFPSEKYIPFFNLKSHGSKWNVLAGMHDCQSKAKVLSANKVIHNLLDKKEIQFLKKRTDYSEVLVHLSSYDRSISKLQLGTAAGIGPEILGDQRLGLERTGLGEAIQGLGVSEGLGIDFSFGTKQVHLNWVLDDLFDNESDRALGFLMLESCDTNRDPELFHSYLDNVLGYYSAKHSLWYRNLNWWTLLERANGSSLELIKILKDETSKIPNIKVVGN